MKLAKAKIIPLQPVNWGNGITKDATLVELTSSEGITGLGSAYTGTKQVREAVELYQSAPTALQDCKGELLVASSAVDIALWDINGKQMGKPVSELMGTRQHHGILAYATVMLPFTNAEPGDEFEKKIRAVLDQGFKAIKLYISGFGRRDSSMTEKEWLARESSLLEFARQIVGPECRLMLDVYGSDNNFTGNYEWALGTARTLEQLNYLWFEEPFGSGSISDYIKLTSQTEIAVSGGEDFTELEDFQKWCDKKAVNILQPDCTRAGGLTSILFIRLAAGQALDVIPHGWNTAVGLAADLQFMSTTAKDSICMVEFMPTGHLVEPLINNPFKLDSEGRINVPALPGLGVELDHQRVADRVGIFDCAEEVIEIF